MNKAESQQMADYLELLGYEATQVLRNANLVILNTCVVRQSAEDKVLGTLGYLKGIKNSNPDLAVLVTGCFVDSNVNRLKESFPQVDLFFKPGDFAELVNWTEKRGMMPHKTESRSCATRNAPVSALIPIVQGCNNFCSYCIVPYRRGRERSRPITEIICEVNRLVAGGTKEVVLLGQNVNSYGRDLPSKPDLSDLLTELHDISGLERIRFLTNHPKDVSQKLIRTIARLDKVCEHINLPLQSGDDGILKAMGRGYTVEQYRQLVHALRAEIPEVALSTDLIVGFPGESEEQFARTLAILEEIRFDTVHVASYSPRPGTLAFSEYQDDVQSRVKKERLNRIEVLQISIAREINSMFVGKSVEVLVEGKRGEKWYGRTRGNKLVFFEDEGEHLGHLIHVTVTKTSPWALQGEALICQRCHVGCKSQ